MAMKKGAASTRNPVLRRAKLSQAVELILRGAAVGDVATLMNVDPKTIRNWQHEAAAKGIVEEVRERLQNTLLPKAVNAYEAILDANVDDITERRVVKAHELKLKAARDIAHGVGALRKESAVVKAKQTVDLDGYFRQREARRVMIQPETVPGLLDEAGESVPPHTSSVDATVEGEIVADLPQETVDGTDR